MVITVLAGCQEKEGLLDNLDTVKADDQVIVDTLAEDEIDTVLEDDTPIEVLKGDETTLSIGDNQYKVISNYDGVDRLYEFYLDNLTVTDWDPLTGTISQHDDDLFHLVVSDIDDQVLLETTSNTLDPYESIRFVDVNYDGYVDISFMTVSGGFNNAYTLYVWSETDTSFVEVTYEGELSYFEIQEDGLKNWLKTDQSSGFVETLVLEGYHLVKISEESYTVDVGQ